MDDLDFLVDITGYLNIVNKELQEKMKLAHEIYSFALIIFVITKNHELHK